MSCFSIKLGSHQDMHTLFYNNCIIFNILDGLWQVSVLDWRQSSLNWCLQMYSTTTLNPHDSLLSHLEGFNQGRLVNSTLLFCPVNPVLWSPYMSGPNLVNFLGSCVLRLYHEPFIFFPFLLPVSLPGTEKLRIIAYDICWFLLKVNLYL